MDLISRYLRYIEEHIDEARKNLEKISKKFEEIKKKDLDRGKLIAIEREDMISIGKLDYPSHLFQKEKGPYLVFDLNNVRHIFKTNRNWVEDVTDSALVSLGPNDNFYVGEEEINKLLKKYDLSLQDYKKALL